MAFPNIAGKRISDFVPILKQQNMDFLAAAGAPGVSIQYARLTQSGSSPMTVSLSQLPSSQAQAGTLRAMADANYMVIAYDLTGQAFLNIPLANITPTAFNISGGSSSDVICVLVIGRLATEAT